MVLQADGDAAEALLARDLVDDLEQHVLERAIAQGHGEGLHHRADLLGLAGQLL